MNSTYFTIPSLSIGTFFRNKSNSWSVMFSSNLPSMAARNCCWVRSPESLRSMLLKRKIFVTCCKFIQAVSHAAGAVRERKGGGRVLSKHFPGGLRLSSFKSLLYFKPKYVMNFSFPVTEITQKSTPYTIERTFNPIHLIRSEIRGTRSLTLGRDYECATETSYNTYWNVPNSAKKSF